MAPASNQLRIIKPIQAFLENTASGGIILIFNTILAMFLANNSFFSEYYFNILHVHINLNIADIIHIDKPLEYWINDFLMAIFFFVIGLEIKREVIAGELSDIKQASLPITAAFGGMLIPALIYAFFIRTHPEAQHGWGIPMATDIAFSLGIISLLGKRIPFSLKIFLTALAIVDDLGAVLVIAIFYTTEIAFAYLAAGFLVFALLLILNRLNVYRISIYMVLGMVLWYCFFKSGVHATIAGVLLALTIPAKRRLTSKDAFVEKIRLSLHEFHFTKQTQKKYFLTDEQSHSVDNIIYACNEVSSPLQRLEHALHPFVAFFIMPIFALANAGIKIESDLLHSLVSPISLAVMFGLFFGKQFGIFFFTWAGSKLKLGKLPPDLSWKHLYGMSCLAGIGFTMSLFIANLAFDDFEHIQLAKIGILAGSILSGILGVTILATTKPKIVEE